jgi:hypothetical protein
MRFWRIDCPSYPGGDYDHYFLNGEVGHARSLPGIHCDTCGETWAGSRTLPFRLPGKVAGRKDLRDTRPISATKHRALRAAVEAALAEEGHRIALRPGDSFQPARVRLPTFPDADFLWPMLGTLVPLPLARL